MERVPDHYFFNAFISMRDMNVKDATQAGIDHLVRKVHGRGGVIVIDKKGYCTKG